LQDLTLAAEIPDSAWDSEAGKASVSGVLGVRDLGDSPLNMSLVAPGQLLLRGFYLNRSQVSNGFNGMESFQDVMLRCAYAALCFAALRCVVRLESLPS
jgi:hypothetical protein